MIPRRPFDWLEDGPNPHHRRGDVRLISAAIKKGWLEGENLQVSRDKLVERLADIATDRTEPSKARISAAMVLIRTEDRAVRKQRRQYRIHTRPILRRLRRLERRLAQPTSPPIRLRLKALEDRLGLAPRSDACSPDGPGSVT
jgi:hypothetical protein